MNQFTLQERFLDFVIQIDGVCKSLEANFQGDYLMKQLFRSGSSAALNYSEARSAESKKDFIHKLKIALKELRESHTTLQIAQKTNNCRNDELIIKSIEECNELITILVTTIKTSQRNLNQ